MIPGIARPDILRTETAAGPATGADWRRLRHMAIAAGLGWAVLFVVVGLQYGLQTYGDGSIFSYSVAVRDAWAFHWHNISGRLFVYLATLLPAEVYVGLTGDPRGGVMLYGLLFYIAPLLGLAATWMADRSEHRVFFTYACVSTACLCPLVFGFPTEMWMAHALLWPTLAACHYAGRGIASAAAVLALLLGLAFTHPGGVVFAAGIVCSVALRGPREPALWRVAGAMLVVMAVWFYVKNMLPPDGYFAVVLPRAAWDFFDLRVLYCPMSLLLCGSVAGYVLGFFAISRFAPAHAQIGAAAMMVAALVAYWLWFDHALHTDNRYYLRTELFLVAPLFVMAAVLQVLRAEGRLGLLAPLLPAPLSGRSSALLAQACAGAVMVAMLVHAVETEKFVSAWSAYKSAIIRLATGTASDPTLGDPRFVSTDRLPTRFDALAWASTTQYLSVLLAPNFAPNRLVVDPDQGYYWLSCETATANRLAARAMPARSRELIGAEACLHSKRRVVMAPAKK